MGFEWCEDRRRDWAVVLVDFFGVEEDIDGDFDCVDSLGIDLLDDFVLTGLSSSECLAVIDDVNVNLGFDFVIILVLEVRLDLSKVLNPGVAAERRARPPAPRPGVA